jgi:hypothetical protein
MGTKNLVIAGAITAVLIGGTAIAKSDNAFTRPLHKYSLGGGYFQLNRPTRVTVWHWNINSRHWNSVFYNKKEDRFFCLLDAPNKKAIEKHHARFGLKCEWITEVETLMQY